MVEPLTDEQVLSAVTQEITWAESLQNTRYSDSEIALDYFYGRRPAPRECVDLDGEKIEIGFSDVVSTDVADTIEAILAEIMPAFSGTSPVEFEPSGAEDEERAAQETAAVNRVAIKAGLYMALNQAIKDALLRRAGVVKVFQETRQRVSYEQHDNLPVTALPMLLEPQSPNETVDIIDGNVDELTGMASGTIRRTKTLSKPRIDPVPLDEFLISANTASPNIEEARYCAHRRPVMRTELIELGFDEQVVQDLQAYQTNYLERERRINDNDLRSADKSTEYVLVVESYYNIDQDGDGIAELRLIVTAGGSKGDEEILLNEPWEEQPFCVGVPLLGIYTWDGVSMFDRMRMIQDVKTDLWRDVVNATKRNLRQRVGVVDMDGNLDDVLTSQMGGAVRMRTPQGIVPLPDVQVPPLAYQALEYVDKQRRDKGGAAVDNAQQAQAIAGDTAHGIERVMASSEQLTAMIAKNLCETLLKPIYRKLHTLLRRYQDQAINLPGSVGWQQTNPKEWEQRDDMVISLGMSVGERTRRAGALAAISVQQQADIEAGYMDVLLDLNGLYQARIDLARMSGLPNPEQYYLDPKSQAAQQALQGQAQQAQEQAEADRQREQEQLRYQYGLMVDIERTRNEGKLQVEQIKATVAQLTTELNAAVKMFGERVKLADVQAGIDEREAQQDVDRLQNQGLLS